MQIEQILDHVYPITDEERKCAFKMQKKMAQRERLRIMIDRYKNGDIVHFDPLCISVDLKEIMKRFEN